MAVDITGSTIQKPLIQKTENQTSMDRNWAFEIVEITLGASNTGTSLVLSTATTAWPAATTGTGVLNLSYPMYITFDGLDVTEASHHIHYAAGSVTITWETAPVSLVFRAKIEGFA